MIINCANCSTSFNLDASILSEEGSKVSCCICANTFTAYPAEEVSGPMIQGAVDPAAEFNSDLTFGMEFSGPNLELGSVEEHLLMLDLPELELDDIEIDFADEAGSETESVDIEFESGGYDEVSPVQPLPEESPDDELQFESFNDDLLDEETSYEPIELEDGDDRAPELSLEDLSDSDFILDEKVINEFDMDAELNADTGIEEFDLVDQGPYPAVMSSTDEEIIVREQDEESAPPPLPTASEKSYAGPGTGGSVFKKIILAAFLAGILLLTFAVVSVFTRLEVPVIQPYIDRVLGPKASTATSLQVSLDEKTVKGRLIRNKAAGRLFVITGDAVNSSSGGIKNIIVKGTLSTKDNKNKKVKHIFCGVIVPEEILKTADMTVINKTMMDQRDKSINTIIPPGGRIPFAVVFSDLPDKLEFLKVEVVKFDNAK